MILGRPAFSCIDCPLGILSFLIPSVLRLSVGLSLHKPPPPPSCILLSAGLAQDLRLLQLVWAVPCGVVLCPLQPPAQVRSPALRDAALYASGLEAGVGRAAPCLLPGGPGSLQAVGLQLQTPKHILWEVSLARGWGIPLFR